MKNSISESILEAEKNAALLIAGAKEDSASLISQVKNESEKLINQKKDDAEKVMKEAVKKAGEKSARIIKEHEEGAYTTAETVIRSAGVNLDEAISFIAGEIIKDGIE